MALSIHHGAPGSYKSFTLVQRFGFDALVSGRPIITNIRGFSDLDKIKKIFPELKIHPDSYIIYITTETKLGRSLMAGFFHWIPPKVLLLIDEGQRIYPKRKGFTLESLDRYVCPEDYTPVKMPANAEFPDGIPRPEDILTAFDMQRHFEWDIYISTPHINKIPDPLREVAVTSFYHTSLAEKLPFLFKNSWYEHKHDPSNTGHSIFQRDGSPTKYKADLRIFQVYQSTATGEYTESKADKNILADTGVRIKFFFVLLAFVAGIYFVPKAFTGSAKDKNSNQAQDISVSKIDVSSIKTVSLVSADQNITQIRNVPNHNDRPIKNVDVFNDLGFKPLMISYQTSKKTNIDLRFIAFSESGLKTVNYSEMVNLGFYASVHEFCRVTLIHKSGASFDLGCSHPKIDKCSISISAPDRIVNRGCSLYAAFDRQQTHTVNHSVPVVSTRQIITKQNINAHDEDGRGGTTRTDEEKA
jgi:zona occludens toxin